MRRWGCVSPSAFLVRLVAPSYSVGCVRIDLKQQNDERTCQKRTPKPLSLHEYGKPWQRAVAMDESLKARFS